MVRRSRSTLPTGFNEFPLARTGFARGEGMSTATGARKCAGAHAVPECAEPARHLGHAVPLHRILGDVKIRRELAASPMARRRCPRCTREWPGKQQGPPRPTSAAGVTAWGLHGHPAARPAGSAGRRRFRDRRERPHAAGHARRPGAACRSGRPGGRAGPGAVGRPCAAQRADHAAQLCDAACARRSRGSRCSLCRAVTSWPSRNGTPTSAGCGKRCPVPGSRPAGSRPKPRRCSMGRCGDGGAPRSPICRTARCVPWNSHGSRSCI